MQHVSLHVKLRNLLESGHLSLKSNPELGHVLAGEGSYYFGADKVQVIPDFVGPSPDGSGTEFTVPHDLAYVKETKTVLAYAPADSGPYEMMPESLRKMVQNFKTNKAKLSN